MRRLKSESFSSIININHPFDLMGLFLDPLEINKTFSFSFSISEFWKRKKKEKSPNGKVTHDYLKVGRQPPLPTIKTCCSILFIVNALTKLYKIFILNFDVFIFLNIYLPLSLVALVHHHLPSTTLLLRFIVILKEKKVFIFFKY